MGVLSSCRRLPAAVCPLRTTHAYGQLPAHSAPRIHLHMHPRARFSSICNGLRDLLQSPHLRTAHSSDTSVSDGRRGRKNLNRILPGIPIIQSDFQLCITTFTINQRSVNPAFLRKLKICIPSYFELQLVHLPGFVRYLQRSGLSDAKLLSRSEVIRKEKIELSAVFKMKIIFSVCSR